MKKPFQLLAFLPLLLFGCGEEQNVDLDRPGMQILSLTPAPSPAEICGAIEDTVFTLRGGELLQADLLFTDDRALSQYKVDIHNNFDCHGHGGAAAPGVAVPDITGQTEDWTVLQLEELSGTEEAVTLTLQAPENVTAGAYHFQVQVLDESGNDNPLANFYSIRAYHPADETPPVLSLAEPASDGFSVAKGSTLRFKGEVTDNYSLSEGGNGIVFLSYTDLSSGNTFTSDTFVTFGEGIDKSYAFDLEFTVPGTLTAGNYRFQVNAYDGVRNVAMPISLAVEVTD